MYSLLMVDTIVWLPKEREELGTYVETPHICVEEDVQESVYSTGVAQVHTSCNRLVSTTGAFKYVTPSVKGYSKNFPS